MARSAQSGEVTVIGCFAADSRASGPEEGVETLDVVPTAHLLPGLQLHLMDLLRRLAPEDWSRPTMAGAWTVKDVAAHLLDSQLRRLSFQRDGLPLGGPEGAGYTDLVGFLNELNATWVRAARRLSPRLLMEFLDLTGPQVAELLASLDPRARCR